MTPEEADEFTALMLAVTKHRVMKEHHDKVMRDGIRDVATPTARRYRVTLWADVLLEDGEPQYTAQELEKHLIKVLRKAEPECDLEVLDYEDVEA